MTTHVLVTGATGTVGSKVVEGLLGKTGVSVRAAARSAGKAVSGAITVALDFAQPETWGPALEGVERLFLLDPLPPLADQPGRFLEAARTAGVQRVVKLSARGADPAGPIQAARWHGQAEQAVHQSGLAWTFVRPANFMQNFLTYYPPDAEGAVYLPWGDAAVNFVDARDVAAVIVEALLGDGHSRKIYELTGPEDLTVAQAADVLSKASGRAIRYVDVPEAAARAGMAAAGMPAVFLEAMMEMHALCKAGYLKGVTNTVETVLGRKPHTFTEFARAHAKAWARASQPAGANR